MAFAVEASVTQKDSVRVCIDRRTLSNLVRFQNRTGLKRKTGHNFGSEHIHRQTAQPNSLVREGEC